MAEAVLFNHWSSSLGIEITTLVYLPPDSLADIDECGIRNGGCTDKCVNKPGSYQCACRSGYKLGDDKLTCSGIASTVWYFDFFLADWWEKILSLLFHISYFVNQSLFKHALLNSKLQFSLATFDETFSSFRTDWRHSTGSWKINAPYAILI